MGVKYRKDQKIGNWTLIKPLGKGGNGEVWECKKGNKSYAIKFLKKRTSKAYQRFRDEIKIIKENSNIKGIIPVVDSHLPLFANNDNPYYIMEKAKDYRIGLKGKTYIEILELFLKLCDTVKVLHEKSISHRDIKPSNILYYKNQMCLSDFGLTDYPNKSDISEEGEVIGPKWTMAPEMRRDSYNSDGLKADIYSLSKTLWIFLMDDYKCFDGQYRKESNLSLSNKYPDIYTSQIDKLIEISTDNNPNLRPDIKAFSELISKSIELLKDFHKRNNIQWKEIQNELFPKTLPTRVIWDRPEDIVDILNTICKYDNLNHLFFPNSGGLDLISAKLASEKECIELNFGSIEIMKPKRLLYESFNKNFEWNYFRLELDNIDPILFENSDDVSANHLTEFGSQEISEILPGKYYPYEVLIYTDKYRKTIPISSESRHVIRRLNGVLVIFNKRSTYNRYSKTYDGRHNQLNTDEFRYYIEKHAKYFAQRGDL